MIKQAVIRADNPILRDKMWREETDWLISQGVQRMYIITCVSSDDKVKQFNHELDLRDIGTAVLRQVATSSVSSCGLTYLTSCSTSDAAEITKYWSPSEYWTGPSMVKNRVQLWKILASTDITNEYWWPPKHAGWASAIFFLKDARSDFKDELERALVEGRLDYAEELSYRLVEDFHFLSKILKSAQMFVYASGVRYNCPGMWYYYPIQQHKAVIKNALGILASDGFDAYESEGVRTTAQICRQGHIPSNLNRFVIRE